jgi:hypothetical protein
MTDEQEYGLLMALIRWGALVLIVGMLSGLSCEITTMIIKNKTHNQYKHDERMKRLKEA